jgi:hypothetical protein
VKTAEDLVYQRQRVSLPRISYRRCGGTYIRALKHYCVIDYPYQEERDRKEARFGYHVKAIGRTYRAMGP